MKNILKHFPNFLTTLNLICGFVAIVLSFNIYTLQYAPFFILIATLFDFTDGLAAKVLNAYSDFGKQLDSLADAVSFGVVPGIFAYQLLQFSMSNIMYQHSGIFVFIILISALVPVFSILRLAKFNIDSRQKYGFYGLPTPASAIFFSSLVIIAMTNQNSIVTSLVLNKYFLISVIIIDSILMISDVPMFSFKMNSFSFNEYWVQFVFIFISTILLLILSFFAIPIIILIYIFISVILYFNKKLSN